MGWFDTFLGVPVRKSDAQERYERDRDWLDHCIAAGAEWRGLRCAICNRPLYHTYTMRVSEAVIDMVCSGGCPADALGEQP